MPTQTLDALGRAVRDVLSEVEGECAVAFREVGSPERGLLVNADAAFHAASTMKTPVMVELYRQARAGKFSLEDTIPVQNAFESIVDGSRYALDPGDDSETELYDRLGDPCRIRTLIEKMIVESSNLATNLLVEMVGPEAVTRTMRQYGAEDIQVRRGVEDPKAYREGLNNIVSARDLRVLFERLAQGTAVDERASREMIQILSDQTYNDMIPARLPGSVTVAHKTGWISGHRHDSGIVFVPDGPSYVLVFLSRDLREARDGIEACAEVSRLVYDYETQ